MTRWQTKYMITISVYWLGVLLIATQTVLIAFGVVAVVASSQYWNRNY